MKPHLPPKNPSRELARTLASEINAERNAEVLSDALVATRTTGAGVCEPDTRSRLEAAKLALYYIVGMPVQRTESVNVNADAASQGNMVARLRSSPALRAAIRRALLEAETGVVDVGQPDQ